MRRRLAWWPLWGFGYRRFRIQEGEELGDDVETIDAGNDSQYAGTDRASLDVSVQSSVPWCVTMDKLERAKTPAPVKGSSDACPQLEVYRVLTEV
jgi:hypothetical protein